MRGFAEHLIIFSATSYIYSASMKSYQYSNLDILENIYYNSMATFIVHVSGQRQTV